MRRFFLVGHLQSLCSYRVYSVNFVTNLHTDLSLSYEVDFCKYTRDNVQLDYLFNLFSKDYFSIFGYVRYVVSL